MRHAISFLFCLLSAITLAQPPSSPIGRPQLIRHGQSVRLAVDGRPMLILGGELSNSAATCISDIDEVMPRMAALGLNTVLIPAQWDLLEPEEGQFDACTTCVATTATRTIRVAMHASLLATTRSYMSNFMNTKPFIDLTVSKPACTHR